MDNLMEWAEFAGVWLLFTGAVFQAMLELQEQRDVREDFVAVVMKVPKPASISRWWWLFPPAHIVLQSRKDDDFRREVMNLMPDDLREAAKLYMDKARGWMIVAAGALLVAVSATNNLINAHGWSEWWMLIALFMAALAASYSIAYHLHGKVG